MRTFEIASLLAVLTLPACVSDGDRAESATSNVGVVPGSALASPNADPHASYLPGRSTENLAKVGALTGILVELAARVDGVVGTQAQDGRITLDELIAVEKPGAVEKLHPSERTALPALWKLLETTTDAPSLVTLPPLDVIAAVDVSDAPTTLLPPASIDITMLDSQLQRVASHLEQLHDDDSNKRTVTPADIAAALAAPAAFQPGELVQLHGISDVFRDQSGTTMSAKVRVTTPNQPEYTPPTILHWDPATLGLSSSVEYHESRTMDAAKGDLTVTLTGHVTQQVMLTAPVNNAVLVIDDASTMEAFYANGALTMDAGTKTVEVWSAGQRLGSYRVTLPKLAPVATDIDLTKYVDYTLIDVASTTHGPTAIKKYPITDTAVQSGNLTTCDFLFDNEAYGYTTDTITNAVATPSFEIQPGRYVAGGVTLDFYPEGVLKVTEANGWSDRAIYRGGLLVLPDSADLRFSYDPGSNVATITKADGTLIFQGHLDGSLRTG